MKMKLLALGMTASLVAVGGCNRDVATPTAVPVEPGVVTTPGEVASQTPEPMPETRPIAPVATPATGPTLMQSQAPLAAGGTYVVDSAGSALYMLEGNRDGAKCTGACLEAWPPLLMGDAQPTGGPGLEASMVASIKRPDGAMQITYNNHPLHRYAADTGRGRTAGHGVRDQWGTWYLLGPGGEMLPVAR